MSKALLAFFITIIILGLAVIVLAAAVADANAEELAPDCPPPWAKVRIFLPFAEQCLGQYCGQEHSGPLDGEPGR